MGLVINMKYILEEQHINHCYIKGNLLDSISRLFLVYIVFELYLA
jgi:hypothetical protein